MKLSGFAALLTAVLFANTDPFVVFNTPRLQGAHHTIVQMPDMQILQGEHSGDHHYLVDTQKPLKLLIEPKETLYLITDQRDVPIRLRHTLDGRVFEEVALKKFDRGYYYINPFSEPVAVVIESDVALDLRPLTTRNTNPLNHFKPDPITFGGQNTKVISPISPSVFYEAFETGDKKTVQVEGPGTLVVEMRAAGTILNHIAPQRQRIQLAVDDADWHELEALKRVSIEYIQAPKPRFVTAKTFHYIPLEKGKHSIHIKVDEPVLLRGWVNRDNFFNPLNHTPLAWKVPQQFEMLNQPRWRNSILNDGLKRCETLLGYSSKIADTLQQKNAQDDAKISTMMRILPPSEIPLGSKSCQTYFEPYQLSLDKNYKRSFAVHDDYKLKILADISHGEFFDVPLLAQSGSNQPFLSRRKVASLHIDPFLYDLNETLGVQLDKLLQQVSAQESLTFSGCTSLSSKESQEIRSHLMRAGMAHEKIHFNLQNSPKKDISIAEEKCREITVEASQYKNHANTLIYAFHKPLKESRELEVYLIGTQPSIVDLQCSNLTDQRLYYAPDINITQSSYSLANDLWDENSTFYGRSFSGILQLINDGIALPYTVESGFYRVDLPVGCKEIRLSRPPNSAPLKVMLKIQDNRVYHESDYALAFYHRGLYREFVRTIDVNYHAPDRFDPWYEHTHPLRLWFRSQLHNGSQLLSERKLPEKSISFLHLLMQNDIFTSRSIAAHLLYYSHERSAQEEGLEILLKLAQNDKERLQWYAVDFIHHPDPKRLHTIAQLLYHQGEESLALDLLLMLPPLEADESLLSTLALSQNRFLLHHYLFDLQKQRNKASQLNQKEALLNDFSVMQKEWRKEYDLLSASPQEHIYASSVDRSFLYYKATQDQGVSFGFKGRQRVVFDLRLLAPTEGSRWIRVVHNGTTEYRYPILNTIISPTLENQSEERAVSVSNSLELTLGEGEQNLTIYGADIDLIVGVKTKNISPQEVVPPLYEQLLDPHRDYQNISPQKDGFMDWLLWRYTFGNSLQRYDAQSRAIMLQPELHNITFAKILRIVTEHARFDLYDNLAAPLGFVDQTTTHRELNSPTQRVKEVLLENIEDYSVVLHGEPSQIITMDGEQNITIEATNITPYFSRSQPLVMGIAIDNGAEFFIPMDENRSRWKRHLQIDQGRHAIVLRLHSPQSAQYIGVNLYENGKKNLPTYSKRYYNISKESPVKLTIDGPKLLRIIEQSHLKEEKITYRYLDQHKLYNETIFPSDANYSLARVEMMVLDPYLYHLPILPLEPPMVPSLPDIQTKQPPPFNMQYITSEHTILQTLDPTLAFGLGYQTVDMLAEDSSQTLLQGVTQAEFYYRERWQDMLYFKNHTFTRLYSDPLLGVENEILAKFLESDMWFEGHLNAYKQQSGGLDYANLKIDMELGANKPLTNILRHSYSVNFFRYFLNYDLASEKDIDPLVFSTYKMNHQYGLDYKYSLFYTPYDDIMVDYRFRLRTNEALDEIDYIENKATLHHIMEPFIFSLAYRRTDYFEDSDRESDYTHEKIEGTVRFTLDNGGDGVWMADAGFAYPLQPDTEPNLIFSLTFYPHLDAERYHFMPSEKLFHTVESILQSFAGEAP